MELRTRKQRNNGIMEQWNNGMMERWNNRMMEQWNTGTMELARVTLIIVSVKVSKFSHVINYDGFSNKYLLK